MSWFLRIRIPGVILADFQEVRLSRGAGILAPKSFHVDCADITTSRGGRKNAVELLYALPGKYGIVFVAAYIISDVLLTGLHGVIDSKAIALVEVRKEVF